jgi:hypothetical protein
MWKHKKYEKKYITPPKVNNSTIMNTNDNEVDEIPNMNSKE